LSGKDLRIEFRQKQNRAAVLNLFGTNPNYKVEVGQNEIPTQMKLVLTAGDGEVDFSALKLTKATIEMTAGDLNMNFKDSSIPEQIDIKLTAGDMTLNLPKDIALELEYNKTAGDIKVDNNNLKNGYDTYTYNSGASKKVKINAKVTAGDLKINFK